MTSAWPRIDCGTLRPSAFAVDHELYRDRLLDRQISRLARAASNASCKTRSAAELVGFTISATVSPWPVKARSNSRRLAVSSLVGKLTR